MTVDKNKPACDGWPPLKLLGKDVPSNIRLPRSSRRKIFVNAEGQHVVSQFDLGAELHHIDIFIEYERTFGRGKASDATHGPLPPMANDRQREVKDAYEVISSRARAMMLSASKEQAKDYIQELAQFRSDFNDLYADIQKSNRPKKKFKVMQPSPAD